MGATDLFLFALNDGLHPSYEITHCAKVPIKKMLIE